MNKRNSLIIDLCSGGGVLAEAFYDSVGLDLDRDKLKYYPNQKIQGSAIQTPFRNKAVYFANGSPPCQAFCSLADKEKHIDIVDPVRKELHRISEKYSIENVVGAPIRKDLMLCQSMFDLPVKVSGLGVPPSFMNYILDHLDNKNLDDFF
jgi:DNA (cytosine-5)-methyltransferase 1